MRPAATAVSTAIGQAPWARLRSLSKIVAPPDPPLDLMSRRGQAALAAPPPMTGACERLQVLRLVDRLREVLIIFAIGAAKLLDRLELLLGEVELALDHVSLPEIFSHLRIGRIERNGFEVV